MEDILCFKKEDLTAFAVKYMKKLGIPAHDAKIVADVLISADLRGVDSHGLIRINTYYGNGLEKNI